MRDRCFPSSRARVSPHAAGSEGSIAAKLRSGAGVITGFLLTNALVGPGIAWAQGENFTLVSNEENTKDMSVNLVADTLRDDRIGPNGKYVPIEFGSRKIFVPTLLIPKEEALALVNHDSGLLDIQHTFLNSAPMASRILIQFQSLKQELKKHCWSAKDADSIRATLRLYVIPPYGPQKHNRGFGVSPTAFFEPNLGIDPPPVSLPIAVFKQQKPWVEGNGQNSFFTATYDESALLDVKRVGIVGPGTMWEGQAVPPVDLCLNRERGRVAKGRNGNQATLCFDENPDWSPWMEWDVSAAVAEWMKHDFDPSLYHGFSLYQYPGVKASDQVRFSPEEPGKARTRAVVTFASSSAKADCPGAGGVFGGPSQAEIVYANYKCMSPEPNDLEPGNENGIARLIEMRTRPEWAPQLVIESTKSPGSCAVSHGFFPERLDAALTRPGQVSFFLLNRRSQGAISISDIRLGGGATLRATLKENLCAGQEVGPQGRCELKIEVNGQAAGSAPLSIEVDYRVVGGVVGDTQVTTLRDELAVTVSEDADGSPDAEENKALNGGDGNGDGVPDRAQDHVYSWVGLSGHPLTLAAAPGTRVIEVDQPEFPLDKARQILSFDQGFLSFKIRGLTPGSATTAELHFHEDLAKGTWHYYGFGPTPDLPATHWYPFVFKGQLGVEVQAKKLVFHLVDGGLGDADQKANGEILSFGGVARSNFATNKSFRLTDATVAAFGPRSLFGLLVLLAVGGGFGWVRRESARG